MGERGRRRRVGEVVGGHVDRLHRSDRALGRRGDALLQRAHVGGERRLIADRRGHAAEQRRDFRARLGEAEDVVDEEQHVLTLIAEILGDGEAGQRDAHARARRLVHLAEHQRAFRNHVRIGVLRIGVDLRLDELVIEIVAFARALADAGEHRIAAVRLGDVVDQLLDEHGLADARAAEQADLAALGVGREQVDDLDAGDRESALPSIARHRKAWVDGSRGVASFGTGPASSTGSPMTFMMRPSVPAPTGTVIGPPVSLTSWPRTKPFRNVHRDAAHGVFAQVLRDFQNQPRASVVGFQRVENGRQFAVELHVDDGADHLGDAAGGVRGIRRILRHISTSSFRILRIARATGGFRAPRRPK